MISCRCLVHRKGPSGGSLEAGVKFLRRLRTRGILGRETWVHPRSFEAPRFEVGHVLDHKPELGKCVDTLTLAAKLCDRTHARQQKLPRVVVCLSLGRKRPQTLVSFCLVVFCRGTNTQVKRVQIVRSEARSLAHYCTQSRHACS